MSDPTNGRPRPHPMQTPAQQPVLPLIAAPQRVGIGPCATEIALADATAPDGKKLIVMQLITPSGVQFFFFEPQLFDLVLERGRQLMSGIELATPALAQQLADALVKRRPQ